MNNAACDRLVHVVDYYLLYTCASQYPVNYARTRIIYSIIIKYPFRPNDRNSSEYVCGGGGGRTLGRLACCRRRCVVWRTWPQRAPSLGLGPTERAPVANNATDDPPPQSPPAHS